MSATAGVRRVRVRLRGTVQGVGFRPYVHRLAASLGVAGTVCNDGEGVVVEAEGPSGVLDAFLARLPAEAPPLARIERVELAESDARGERGFVIAPSGPGSAVAAPVPADAATCDACLAELLDPDDRRFRHPFITCTSCGPRFTIVEAIPYDRARTTMAGFAMCAACRAEYEDPADRRFHAEAIACPDCGPRARLLGAPEAGDAVAAAAALLREGAVVAVKGLGGYHLACRADDEAAVGALRARKHREDRPFAVMAADVAAARELAVVGEAEAALLSGPVRPIVLLGRREDARVAAAVAPGRAELGLMLPYTPLHHLLLRDVGVPLVMTSGNVSDEPIAFRDDEALARLAPLADDLLVHDRPIRTRTDDSVARVVRGRPQLVRRSRGHVPGSLPLPVAAPQALLAVGAELNSTFCVADGTRAWVSHHIGDLGNHETLRSLADGVAHFEELLAVAPAVVVHDRHPDYLSTRFAEEREGARLLAVQHHHAHLAAVLAEHGESGPAVGAIFDGAGLGDDGTVWGGEILVGDLLGFRRADHLPAVPLPGGDAAAREPWRMACAWLGPDAEPLPGVDPRAWAAVARMTAPLTTSMGRLFDAVAALCGLRLAVTHEGQAAAELEAACAPGAHGTYAVEGLDLRPVVAAVAPELAGGAGVPQVAARFHDTVALATAGSCARAAAEAGVATVALGGGVWQNRRLLEETASLLEDAGLRVLVPERLPPNDGAIAYGQAAIAAAFLAEEARATP